MIAQPLAAPQTLSSRTLSTSMAFSDTNRNIAENVPRLILFAMLVSVSFRPWFFQTLGQFADLRLDSWYCGSAAKHLLNGRGRIGFAWLASPLSIAGQMPTRGQLCGYP